MCWQSFSLLFTTPPPDGSLPARARKAHDQVTAWTGRRPAGRAIVAGLLGGGLFVLDSVLLAGFSRAAGWGPALAAHLGLVVVTALPGFGLRGPPRSARLQLAAWTALLGPFGVLIGLTTFLPRSGALAGTVAAEAAGRANARPCSGSGAGGNGDEPGRGGDPAAWLDTLREGLADGRLRLAGGHAVRPLLDVMIEGTGAEKLEALGLVAKRYVPGLAPTLRRALQDADGSVRMLAATVMAKLRDGHTRRIGLLQDAAAAAGSGSAAAREAWQALGHARLAYAASGLLEPDRAHEEAADGRACLARGADGSPDVPPPHPATPATASPGSSMADCLAG